MTTLFSDISTLHGVGKKRAEAYARLGITSPYDLLYHIPRTYLDYRHPVPLATVPLGETAVIFVTVLKKYQEQRIRKGLSVFKALATDGETDFTVTIFNNLYAFQALHEGASYYMLGKVGGMGTRRELASPQILPADSPVLLQPVYPMTTGLTGSMIQTNIRETLQLLAVAPFDGMPERLRTTYVLCPLETALRNIHLPESAEALAAAKRRLAFDELLQLQLGMLLLRGRNRAKTAYPMSAETDISAYASTLPFTMTGAQQRAISEICQDLCGEMPMSRLLQGDVGSGKTAVAAGACYFAYCNGMQSALMAPTEILATQHFHTLQQFLSPLGVQVALLTGSMPAKQKREVKAALASGAVHVLVGTHAIIQKDTEYQKLGLVITDEQHRFGVAQRAALAEKGGTPHKLVMSATPIPRTLALIIYGDLDISVLGELPNGRLPIQTYAVTGKVRQRAYGFLGERLAVGEQVYIVCPMIEDSESDLQSVCSYAERVQREVFQQYRVGLLHGRMRGAEKDAVMAQFKAGEIQVLVCTTVVEVGVDVPNATVMLIENSERFGLSQLHQLRGRVGRGTQQSHCILVTDHVTEESRNRLKIMSSTTDGFRIAEEDLKLRGPGDFFGHRQHGLPPVHMADLAEDMELVHATQEAAKQLVEEDPELTSPEYHALRMDVVRLFARNGENGLN